jgi:hypothetical protein
MPTIAYFYGISIKMYFNEHPPPHFTADIVAMKPMSRSEPAKSSKAIFLQMPRVL